MVMALALGYFAFDKFVLAPRREAALVASAGRADVHHVSDYIVRLLARAFRRYLRAFSIGVLWLAE